MHRIILLLLVLTPVLFAQPKTYFQQHVRYDIDVVLHPENKTYSGSETVTYQNNSPETLHFIWFHFYPNAFKDESTPYAKQQERFRNSSFHFSAPEKRGYLNLVSARRGDRDLNWQAKSDAIDEIKIELDQPLLPGEKVTLHLKFEGKFPRVNSRMKYFGDNYFAATQWYPKVVVFDGLGWHPDSYLDMGEFYGEFGAFDVSITLPKNFVIEATGTLHDNSEEEAFIREIVARTNELAQLKTGKERSAFVKDWKKERKAKTDYSQTKTVRFVAENVHDFAWFAGDEYMMYQSVHNNGVLTNVLAKPGSAYSWRDVTRFVEQTLWFYSDRVGKYEYPKASVVEGDESGAGMEYPMVTILSMPDLSFVNGLEMVVMHEVGHNWFYGMLGTDERREAFMDEGFNTFLETKYMEHFHGFNNMTNFRKLTKLNWPQDIGEWHLAHLMMGMLTSMRLDLPMNLPTDAYESENYGAVHYQKGAMMLYSLEWLVGADDFWKGMQLYFDTWSGKHPTSRDFFEIMERVSGKDLDWFSDEWVTTTHTNNFELTKSSTVKTANGFKTTVFVENNGSMKRMPAPVNLITAENDTLEQQWLGNPDAPVVFELASKPKKVEVNLKRPIFETNYLDNAYVPDVDVNFLFQIPRFDTYAVNFFPYYWYEENVDRSRVGLGFWSGNFFTNDWLSRGEIYYGTESGAWGYGFKVKNRFPGLLLNFSEVTAGIRDKDGLKNVSLGLRTVHVNPKDTRFKLTFNLGMDHVRLHDVAYSDAGIFEPGAYSIVTADGKMTFRRMLYRIEAGVSVETAIGAFDSEADFLKLEVTSLYTQRFTRNFSTKVKFFGSGIWGDDLPSQERIYLGGAVDPKHQRFALARRGDLSPLRTWTFGQGMNMAGYAYSDGIYPSGKAGAAVTAEFNYTGFPLPIFYGSAATLSQSVGDFGTDDVIFEAGIKAGSNILTFIMPIWVSDPLAGEDHFEFRFLFNLNLTAGIGFEP
ncbi:MAG: M1 family aminopeptidase [Candidatus Zhuqueibacterota bacterium]